MSRIPMIGQPLVERQYFCEHNKIPQEVRTIIYQNQAIRLKEMSRLRKLGERQYRLCRECNEHICACLWSQYGQKPIIDERSMSQWNPQTNQREYAQGKGWSFRNQLLNKFREGYNRCKCNLATSTRDNNLIKCKDSVVWLLRPTKFMRESETNIIVRPKSHQCTIRGHQATPPLPSCKYKQDPESGVPGRTVMYNWKTRIIKPDVDETVAIAKGTKEYFNERKKRLHDGLFSDEIMPELPLIESQLEKALLQQKQNCANYENQTALEDPFLSYTNMLRQNSLEKLLLQNSRVEQANNFEPQDFFEEILAMQSAVSMVPSMIERQVQGNCGNWKLKMECIDHAQDPNFENARFEMASKHDDDDIVDSGNEEEEQILYTESQTGNISDYMWLKKTSTDIKLPSQIEERIQTSTQTSCTSFKNGQLSNSSLAVNWTGSYKRMNDFEMSESGQRKKLHFAISEIEETDDGASLPKIEEEILSEKDEENVNKTKTPITDSKKQRKGKKFKHMRAKRGSSRSSESSSQSVEENADDGKKNMENDLKNIVEEKPEKSEEEPEQVKFNRRVLNVSDNQIIRRPLKTTLKLPKRGSKSENNASIGHNDTSLTAADQEAFSISYFAPVKYERN